MAAIRIVTDSASDLSEELADQSGIVVVPLTIRFGDKEFVDRVELTIDEFYEKMAGEDELPETAAPAPGAFEQAFRRLADDGADGVVCINLSSELSATMQAAQNGALAVGDGLDVRVIDSKSITSGLGTMVLQAAGAAETGASLDEIEALVQDSIGRTRVYGALDTLENLKKGGRIGGVQHLVGTILSIKPIVDISSGVVEEAAKQRTRGKALAWIRDRIASEDEVEQVAVMHAQAPDVERFLEMLNPIVDADRIRVDEIGAVIATHGGPGVIGVTYQVSA